MLTNVCKAFVRPDLDYDEITYDEAYSETLHQKLESIHTLKRAIRVSSKRKLDQELGLDSLQRRHWYRKLYLFHKIFREKKPFCFSVQHQQKIQIMIPEIQIKLLYFILNIIISKISFPSTVIECNELDPNLRSAGSLGVFKKSLLVYQTTFKQFFQLPQLQRNEITHKATSWSNSFPRAQIQAILLNTVNDSDRSLSNTNHSTKSEVFFMDFFSKTDQIHSFLRIWSHLPKKSLMENFIFLCSE